MKQEDKELLLKDLCARLPYGVIVNVNGNNEKVDEINPFEGIITCGFQSFDVNECKPYLRSMSSMTEKEEIIYEQLIKDVHYKPRVSTCCKLISWLKENYFDYNYLIEKGLALEAPKGMYKIN